MTDGAVVQARGVLRGLEPEYARPVRYTLRLDDTGVCLNDLLGETLSLESAGRIECRHCGADTRSSYGHGYCYGCFKRLARCDLCVMSPTRCHHAQGTCREPEWAEGFCMQLHTVYLANSSGPKVGITRQGHELQRWMNQGAVEAVPILHADTRRDAGFAEAMLGRSISDRTTWRRMVSGDPAPMHFDVWRNDLKRRYGDALDNVRWLDDMPVTTIEYPVLTYGRPERVRLSPDQALVGRLVGLKGQFLLFDRFVVNVAELTGHQVILSSGVTDPTVEKQAHFDF